MASPVIYQSYAYVNSRKPRVILFLCVFGFCAFVIWAYFAQLDEVATGPGKVTPSSREQTIQTLEPGRLAELYVREGDVVESGQKLALLDSTQAQASVGEALARVSGLRARAARLRAEIDQRPGVSFPDDLDANSEVVRRERELFTANRSAFQKNLANMLDQQQLASRQLEIARPLLATGAATEIEVLRLQSQLAELTTKIEAMRSDYFVNLKNDYDKTMSELEPLLKVTEGRKDLMRRTLITSPARGVVKDIRVTTIGGVVPSGGVLMQIVPLDDQLLVETKLNPRDVAFIHPGQYATVKISAYDSSIYGSLEGKVDRISADTIMDDVDRRIVYYRVYVLTDHAYLETKDGKRHPIMPGMVTTTEIRTGGKTVFQYLIQPLNRAGEALRER